MLLETAESRLLGGEGRGGEGRGVGEGGMTVIHILIVQRPKLKKGSI